MYFWNRFRNFMQRRNQFKANIAWLIEKIPPQNAKGMNKSRIRKNSGFE